MYNYDGGASEQDAAITRFRLKFDASKFAGDDVYCHFSGSLRSSSQNDFNTSTPDDRIYYANVEIKKIFSLIDMQFGRAYIGEIAGARVDGAHIKLYTGKTTGVGVFAGQLPDPYEDKFTGDYMTYGAYFFTHSPTLGLNAGYVSTLFNGSEDTTYATLNGHLLPSKNMSLYMNLRSDHNVDTGSYELTNLMVSLNLHSQWRTRLGITFNQYRAVKLYESMDYDINHDLQSTIRLSGHMKFTKTSKLYGRVDARTRESDSKSASLMLVGFKQSNLFRIAFFDLSYRSIDYFTTTAQQAHGSIGVNLEKMTVELGTTYMQSDQDNSDTSMTQFIYEGSLDWYLSPAIYVSGKVEMSNEKYLDVDSIYLAKESDEFNTMTFFLYAGYKF